MDYGKSGRFDAKALRRKEKRLLVLTQEGILYCDDAFALQSRFAARHKEGIMSAR